MPASKIQDEGEVIRWLTEGRTYQWIIDEYRRKYNIETTVSMWSNFRSRRGLSRRLAWNEELVPWAVKREHRWRHPVSMLRQEARRRAGMELSPERLANVLAWAEGLREQGLVVHYDPDTVDGFHYVAARPGIDTDLVRVPQGTPKRKVAAD